MANHVAYTGVTFSSNSISHLYWITYVVFVATFNAIHVDALECGTVILYRQTVLGGNEVVKGEWSFIAALYQSQTFEYFCGGTIISDKHVLTAAYCIQPKGRAVPLTPDEITVRLGAFNLTDRSEKDAVNKNVTQIHLHPDWKYNEERYDGDIAILVLGEQLSFSKDIRPVCIPPSNYLLDGLKGTVVGWGKTENGTVEGVPRKIEVNALNDLYCYETDNGIASYVSERSFCGEGSGIPYEGDSGGGFFAVDGSGWIQFGTVSFVRPKGTGTTLKIATYMKLTSLRDWIAETVEQSGSNISLATMKGDLKCSYSYNIINSLYGCLLHNLNIRQENFVVKEFTGIHDLYKGNGDVEVISFASGVMASLPRNFGKIFRNLRVLHVGIDTRICRSSLENLERLEKIQIYNNNVAELDENSLWELPNLEFFRLKTGKLKLLHAATFSRNSKLILVVIDSNALTSLPSDLFQNNFLLYRVSFDNNAIENIDENFFTTNANLRGVSFRENRLRYLSENLFRNNPKLEYIDFSYNRITTIDGGIFATNTKLMYIILAFNELKFLPVQLLQSLESLGYIAFNDNSLTTIDEHFFETNVRLEQLYLGSNKLTNIPANLFRYNSQLRDVDLNSNLIETVDQNLFAGNSKLKTVSLENNLISEFPGNLFRNNVMLETVIAHRNLPLIVSENLFERNTRLRVVGFTTNSVILLHGKLFQNNSFLEVVHFDFNLIRVIDEHTFQWNTNLREVKLNHNRLNNLPERLFHYNHLLQFVDLSGNLLGHLNENIFNANTKLEKIYLVKCGLTTLPSNLFHSNSQLKYVSLNDNKLKSIKTDFSILKHVSSINLSNNVCIDYAFNVPGIYMPKNSTESITEFQNIVTNNCEPKILIDTSDMEQEIHLKKNTKTMTW